VSAAHSHTPRLDKEAVLAALRIEDVISFFALKGRRVGDEFRTGVCPACGPRNRGDSVAINMLSGRWSDHAHGCSGDIWTLIAGYSGLDVKRDFDRVVEIGGTIAGVTPDADPEAIARAAARRRELEAKLEEKKRADRERAIKHAAAVWLQLSSRSFRGENYLRDQRGLDAEHLAELDVVRFGQSGDPFVALRSSKGEILNCVRRVIDPRPDGPKVVGLPGCPTAGTLVGALPELRQGARVVITEGVIDTLTAYIAWPDAIVLGAHGVSRYAMIVGVVAPLVVARSGELLLVGHDDQVGRDALDESMKLAIEAGLVTIGAGGEPRCSVRVVAIGGAKDLNDAYRAGWRP
jgi:hypothetical protein